MYRSSRVFRFMGKPSVNNILVGDNRECLPWKTASPSDGDILQANKARFAIGSSLRVELWRYPIQRYRIRKARPGNIKICLNIHYIGGNHYNSFYVCRKERESTAAAI